MVAKSTVKLIDEAIIPALILMMSKIVGILLVNYFFKINFNVHSRDFLNLLPSITYPSAYDYIRVENYSNLLMFIAAAMGTLMVLTKAHFFHESHISPKFHQKLVNLNLEKLISSSFHLYHQALIWMIFLWLVTIFLILSSISKVMYPQITVLAIIIAINFSWILALDIQKEIEIERDHD
ncbi:MAG: hypothetical protein UU23_C0002G0015 [Candidatus Curtissbacteria bacterium GW2011_GWA1_40_9]|uniref:Uncharacterized protein n=1 Tax=Candidatus Curtissbacteria bacterium GW2011_GWA1_40_9 TaxID=1618408 RepID=A0A0G0TMI8_9BACT|nr:MAG: hypothetical protein UU23_C0002G0015 [Candidatus Curtissbacteria bacterium GW2011_GWA1_40_9]